MPGIQPPRGSGPLQRGGVSERQRLHNFRSPSFFSDATYKISGVTKDSTGAALPNCIVNLFYTRDDVLAATVESSSVGEFTFFVTPNLFFYIVAYKAGAPDVAGTTVNTLVATLSGETPSYDDDAQDYFNRVADAGGLISLTTKVAISAFATSAKANGYWTKLNRVNLFVGDFTSVFIPLKVGTGAAIDTNFNFVAGDYSEAIGLTGNGTTKYLNTGLIASTLSTNSTHLAVYNRTSEAVGGNAAIGNNDVTNSVTLFAPFSDGTIYSDQYNSTGGRVSFAITGATGMIVASRISATDHKIYRNGASIATSATSGGSLTALPFFVFATNGSGIPSNHTSHTFGGYSIGSGLTGAEAASYNTDMEVFQDALSRGVQ